MRSRRRGVTLLIAIGMVTVLMMAATMLITHAGERYHHAQWSRDRLQALECAQAGLLCAEARIAMGDTLGETTRLDLGEAGFAEVTVSPGNHVVSVGSAVRDGDVQATRRLVIAVGGAP